jgi:hypothetical protein
MVEKETDLERMVMILPSMQQLPRSVVVVDKLHQCTLTRAGSTADPEYSLAFAQPSGKSNRWSIKHPLERITGPIVNLF